MQSSKLNDLLPNFIKDACQRETDRKENNIKISLLLKSFHVFPRRSVIVGTKLHMNSHLQGANDQILENPDDFDAIVVGYVRPQEPLLWGI